jgi:hypothetical protein
MAKTVVTLPLVGIRKDAVSLSRLFEFFFSAGVVRILVRVITHCQPAVCALYFLISGGACHT